jgi:hypothetical protein
MNFSSHNEQVSIDLCQSLIEIIVSAILITLLFNMNAILMKSNLNSSSNKIELQQFKIIFLGPKIMFIL